MQLNVKPINSRATYRFNDTVHLNMEIIEDRHITKVLLPILNLINSPKTKTK